MRHSLQSLASSGSLALLLIAGTAAMGHAEDQRLRRTVSVSATGTVNAEPDQATIATGVIAEGETARAALNANTAVMTKLVDGLKAVGIAANDIKTTAFNISPRYQNYKDGRPARSEERRVGKECRL